MVIYPVKEHQEYLEVGLIASWGFVLDWTLFELWLQKKVVIWALSIVESGASTFKEVS